MLTQIFIPSTAGCQPEFTKIASHSFGFTGNFSLGNQTVEKLFIAGDHDPTSDDYMAVWSATNYNYGSTYTGGTLRFKPSLKSAGIALPINLVAEDKVTISGTAQYDFTAAWIKAGFTSVNLIVGVYYFNCSQGTPESVDIYTFIPIKTAEFDPVTGTACFSAEVTLGSNFDIHETRFVIGYNTYAVGDAITPGAPRVLSVSHTLDIQRPCKAETDNFIIRNCCVPIITELVHIPGLVVGDFHVDDEGNCWEVIEASTDVTNFTRNFIDTYTSCVECQAANPCPLNLSITSCCVPGKELVSGSLPGLNVGDTFVDNYGLCWYVGEETSAPITEESITVGSIITGDCGTCKIANPCPNFYYVGSCCASIEGFIAVPDVLNEGDAFVDAQGQCWSVLKADQNELPTIYGIEVVTVYTSTELDTCTLCKTANPCPTEYFVTIRGCCDPERIEVASIPAEYMAFGEGAIFNDWWGVCWEVMSFSTTGVETYPVWDWNSDIIPNLGGYKECKACSCANSGCKCKTFYQVRNCDTNEISIFKMQPNLTIGLFYINQLDKVCYEVLGYGYPAFNESPVAFNPETKWPDFTTCEECNLANPTTQKELELTPCCGGPNINVIVYGSWVNGIGSTQSVQMFDGLGNYLYMRCYTLVGLSTGPLSPPFGTCFTNSANAFPDCVSCTDTYGCK